MEHLEAENLRVTTADFVETHCRNCAAGQTITRHAAAAHPGGKGTFCRSLHEWVTDAEGVGLISDCDCYEAKE